MDTDTCRVFGLVGIVGVIVLAVVVLAGNYWQVHNFLINQVAAPILGVSTMGVGVATLGRLFPQR